jgi:catechol 2,3-dioxygenase-like lactoylglutathione lyase family enzyme
MIRIGSIVLRVDDLQRQTEFWEAALGYVRRDSGESDDFVLLARPTAPGRTSHLGARDPARTTSSSSGSASRG